MKECWVEDPSKRSTFQWRCSAIRDCFNDYEAEGFVLEIFLEEFVSESICSYHHRENRLIGEKRPESLD